MLFPNFKEADVHEDTERIAKEIDDKSNGITFEREVKYT